jgi:hypothetical protein
LDAPIQGGRSPRPEALIAVRQQIAAVQPGWEAGLRLERRPGFRAVPIQDAAGEGRPAAKHRALRLNATLKKQLGLTSDPAAPAYSFKW